MIPQNLAYRTAITLSCSSCNPRVLILLIHYASILADTVFEGCIDGTMKGFLNIIVSLIFWFVYLQCNKQVGLDTRPQEIGKSLTKSFSFLWAPLISALNAVSLQWLKDCRRNDDNDPGHAGLSNRVFSECDKALTSSFIFCA